MPAITNIQFESAPSVYGDKDVIVLSFEADSWYALEGDLSSVADQLHDLLVVK